MKKEDEELVRAFICIDFPDEVIKEITRVQEVLRKRKFTGKITEPENLHLTLKFLGEISKEKVEEVKERLKKVKFKEVELKLGELGTFSFRGNPRIVWIKVNGDGIWDLQKKVDESLNGLFEKEERFMSHLTIARIKYVKDKNAFVEQVDGLGVKEIKFNANKFKLMKSELRLTGPVYTVIEEYFTS